MMKCLFEVGVRLFIAAQGLGAADHRRLSSPAESQVVKADQGLSFIVDQPAILPLHPDPCYREKGAQSGDVGQQPGHRPVLKIAGEFPAGRGLLLQE
ncbi:MAG: hypothetical protein ACD_75C01956G0002 [uncultured bacterium]|nr:MAG: hypothetical protein ACD_75C01956G0002 [uncultured bacterium]